MYPDIKSEGRRKFSGKYTNYATEPLFTVVIMTELIVTNISATYVTVTGKKGTEEAMTLHVSHCHKYCKYSKYVFIRGISFSRNNARASCLEIFFHAKHF